MKANQKFVKADEAVSPVIGVILMVAITVVLAAVVFVLVSDLGDTGDAAPQMSFNANDSDRTVTVIKSDTGLTWQIGAGTDDDVLASGCAALAGVADGAAVTAGQVFTGCVSGETFQVTHLATNTLIYSHAFP